MRFCNKLEPRRSFKKIERARFPPRVFLYSILDLSHAIGPPRDVQLFDSRGSSPETPGRWLLEVLIGVVLESWLERGINFRRNVSFDRLCLARRGSGGLSSVAEGL